MVFVLAVREFSHVHVKSLPDPLGIGIGIVIATRSLCPLSVCVGANDVGVPDDQAPLDGAHDIHVYVCARARVAVQKSAHLFTGLSLEFCRKPLNEAEKKKSDGRGRLRRAIGG